MSIVAEAPGYIQVFFDGSVKRFEPEIATASIEPCNGYKSKDVIIDPLKPISGRMYLPDFPESGVINQQLPVLVYFHGGGFCIGSTTWLGYHLFLGDLSVASKSIILSVDYRLAPENKLPTAYEDCYSALEWLIKNLEIEPWLKRANLDQVFLSGDSAGGNIVHQVAIRAIRSEDFRGRLKGLLPIHPYFGSETRTELEMANGSEGDVKMNDMFWRLSLPQGSNRDYFGCNFENAEMSAAEFSQFPAVIVFVAGSDFLIERGVKYAEFLKKNGVKRVELVEAEGQVHVYHVFHPESEATRLLQKQMSDFIHSL
ncbi:PREDICTED: probable carboxylesterase 17 [Nicotiana attenuata]|uniref:Carboxylesterase 17 n=1 Tax=Nicotiana attenuata TaxID=49451 RepID=A0A314KJI6_NICAT|nr:PREDICTED: probable carboxylesterase 17 [Nicotiana attenuata]OIT29433.1 putative carboxylesterase 17 [Nicotiana attenuata]